MEDYGLSLYASATTIRRKALSVRFDKIVSLLRPNHTLYDLCCDHGLIGFAALSHASRVVFVDQSPPAIQAVFAGVSRLNPADRARTEILVCPGELVDISSERAADFVIAGVGVTTVASIVSALFPKVLGEHRLILSPHQDSTPLRWFLRDKGFRLQSESVVKERGRYREMIVVESNGDVIGEVYANSSDELSREYIAWLAAYRVQIEKIRGLRD